MNADICLIPLTLRSGTIKGVESWESYKALRKAMRSGRDSDIRAVGKAIVKDMSDPKKAKAYNEGVQLAEQGARAAQIMLSDHGEIGKLMDEARRLRSEMKEDKAQMKAYVKKKEMAGEAHYRAVQSYLAKPSKDIAKQMNKTVQDYGHGDASTKLQNAMDNMNSIKAKDVVKTFGKEKGEKLLEIFGLYRKARDFQYYNGKNPFAEKPLSWIDNGETLFIVHPQFLLNAIFEYVTNILENPKNHFAEKYKKAKADIVENQFLKCHML